MMNRGLFSIRLLLTFLLIICITNNIFAVTDPYRAIIDKDIYQSGNKIFITQFVYDFDFAKSHIEEYVKPSQIILVEKEILNGVLTTKSTREYSSYLLLLLELESIGPLKVLRPEIGLEAELFWFIITGEYIEKNVSPVFKANEIEVRNISTAYTFDGNSPEEYKLFCLVQVDYLHKHENLYERYRKTVLVNWEALEEYSDPDSFYSRLNIK